MEHVYCVECGQMIATQRLKALPDTRTCVGCSRVLALTEDDVDLDGSSDDDMRSMVQTSGEHK